MRGIPMCGADFSELGVSLQIFKPRICVSALSLCHLDIGVELSVRAYYCSPHLCHYRPGAFSSCHLNFCRWIFAGLRREAGLMDVGDRLVGLLLLIFSVSLFSYYTFWVIITPFVDSDHFIHSYFPAREFAVIIPVFAGVILLSLLLIFVGVVMLHARKPNKLIRSQFLNNESSPRT